MGKYRLVEERQLNNEIEELIAKEAFITGFEALAWQAMRRPLEKEVAQILLELKPEMLNDAVCLVHLGRIHRLQDEDKKILSKKSQGFSHIGNMGKSVEIQKELFEEFKNLKEYLDQ